MDFDVTTLLFIAFVTIFTTIPLWEDILEWVKKTWPVGVVGVICLGVGAVVAIPLMRSIPWSDLFSSIPFKSEIVRNYILFFGGLGGLFGLAVASKRASTAEKQADTASSQLFNERLGRGADLLSNKQMNIRRTGILVLEDLAKTAILEEKKLITRIIHDFIVANSQLKYSKNKAGNYIRNEENKRVLRIAKPGEKRLDIELAVRTVISLAESSNMTSEEISFNKIDLRLLDFSRLNTGLNIYFQESVLNGAIFFDAKLNRAEFFDSRLIEEIFEYEDYDGANFVPAKLNRINFNHAELNGSIFFGSELNKARFFAAKLNEADFRNAVLNDAYFEAAELKEADFRYAVSKEVSFEYTLSRKADFRYTELDEASFEYADCSEANFKYAELYEANFKRSRLRKADFRYAELSGANFEYADCSEANFKYTDCSETDFWTAFGFTQNQVTQIIFEKGKEPSLPKGIETPKSRAYVWQKDKKGTKRRRFVESSEEWSKKWVDEYSKEWVDERPEQQVTTRYSRLSSPLRWLFGKRGNKSKDEDK